MLLLGSDLFSTVIYNGLKKKFDIKFMCKYCSDPSKYSDINIVASYGIKIPQNVVDHGKWLNVHPSLLPEFRGPTPLEYGLLYGKRMGITLITLNEKIDSGELYAQLEIPYKLQPYYKTNIYHAEQAVELLSAILPNINQIKTIPQCGPISYTKKLDSKLAMVEFSKLDAIDIVKRYYSISHRYSLRTFWRKHLMFIHDLQEIDTPLSPGEFQIHDNFFDVGCKSGSLRISKVSRTTGILCDPKSYFNGLRYSDNHGTFNKYASELTANEMKLQ